MSFHNKPEWNTPELTKALEEHGLSATEPSQLADAFRCGWFAARKTEDQKDV